MTDQEIERKVAEAHKAEVIVAEYVREQLANLKRSGLTVVWVGTNEIRFGDQ